MEKWHKKAIINIFFQIQKTEKLYWFLEIISTTIMIFSIYLFLFFLQLYEKIQHEAQQLEEKLGSILVFSEQGLHILIVGCIFIGILTLQSLFYFRTIKNQKRLAVLRVLGFNGKWSIMSDIMEAFLVVLISSIVAYACAATVFLMAVKQIMDNITLKFIWNRWMFFQLFLISSMMLLLLLVSYYIFRNRKSYKSIAEQMRTTEHFDKKNEKHTQKQIFLFLAGIYMLILFIIANQIKTMFICTIILSIIILCNYVLSDIVFYLIEKLVNENGKHKQKKEFWKIVLQAGKFGKKSIFLSTIVATCLVLFYFLLSVHSGMEGFLERYWIQSRQTNMYIDVNFNDTSEVEKWLNKRNISYQKLYLKELQEEGVMLAVSKCKEKESAYYVEKGHMKTILYNMYRWKAEAGDMCELLDSQLIMDEAIPEEGFQLISYTCLVNYEDWKQNLDNSYAATFAIYADRKTAQEIEAWTQEHGIESMTASRYMKMIQKIYAPYLQILKIILVILSISILNFLYVSILSNIITREREFIIYRGCGIGWEKIGKMVLTQFSYIAISASVVSAIIYGIAFNLIKWIWMGNVTTYFVGVRQLFAVTLIVCALISLESLSAMKFIQKRNKTVAKQLRAD